MNYEKDIRANKIVTSLNKKNNQKSENSICAGIAVIHYWNQETEKESGIMNQYILLK